MKIKFVILLVISIINFSFAQDLNFSVAQELNFDVQATYKKSIKKEILEKAKTMIDINPGYPSEWISNYVSSSVHAICNGKIKVVNGADQNLNAEQQSILKVADLGSDVSFNIKYKTTNSINQAVEVREVNFVASIVPDMQAEFPGGKPALKKYIKETAMVHLLVPDVNKFPQTILRFTIDEQGVVSETKVTQSSKDLHTDQLLLESLKNMEKWKPAQNLEGKKVKQIFALIVGNMGC